MRCLFVALAAPTLSTALLACTLTSADHYTAVEACRSNRRVSHPHDMPACAFEEAACISRRACVARACSVLMRVCCLPAAWQPLQCSRFGAPCWVACIDLHALGPPASTNLPHCAQAVCAPRGGAAAHLAAGQRRRHIHRTVSASNRACAPKQLAAGPCSCGCQPGEGCTAWRSAYQQRCVSLDARPALAARGFGAGTSRWSIGRCRAGAAAAGTPQCGSRCRWALRAPFAAAPCSCVIMLRSLNLFDAGCNVCAAPMLPACSKLPTCRP